MGEAGSTGPRVSVVIVTYGTGPIVLEAIDAVRATTTMGHEVIVVDNPPDDQRPRTADILRGRDDIVLVEADRNLGFAGGNELGVEHASGEYVCFLNPDAVVQPGWLDPLVEALDDPAVGVAAPVLLHPDGSLQEAGQVLFDVPESEPVGGPALFPGDTSQLFDRDVDYASAACWLVRRADHLARGGFDLRYERAYFEDTDYALRMERDGQRTRLVSTSRVVHHDGLGGAGGDVVLAQIAQTVFKEIWGDTLEGRFPRPRNRSEAFRNRDRLAERSTAYLAPVSWSTSDRRAAAFTEALDLARARPRERVTFITDTADGLDRDVTGSAGLEVAVVGDVERELADRRSRVDEVRRVWSPSRAASTPAFRVVIAALLVALVGAYVRSIVLRSPAGLLNADEAYTGIQAFEILKGAIPITLGGSVYTWPFESYLYAPIVAMFGGGVLSLKLLATASWVVAAGVAYRVGLEMRGRRAGVLAATLVWLTPGALLIISVTAYVSYSSGMLVTLAAFLFARRIVDAPIPRHRETLALGVLAGLGFWMHPMFLATLAPIVVVVLVAHAQRRSVWAGVIGGGVLGCSPFLAWNASNGWPSLETPVDVEGSYFERLTTFVRDLLPRAFGLKEFTFEWHLGWFGPLLYAAMLALVVVGAVIALRRVDHRSRVLLPVVLVAVLPVMALFSPLIYAADGRYGVIAFPFITMAVVLAVDALMGEGRGVRSGAILLGLTAFWLGGLIVPTVRPLSAQTGSNPNAVAEMVVARLDEAGIEYVYGSYWSVLPVEYAGSRRITGGVFDFWPIRFPERQRIVEAQQPEHVAIVFGLADEDPFRLFLPVDSYVREQIGGTVVYIPIDPVGHSGGG